MPDLHAVGIQEMTQLAAQAAGTGGFSETALRSTLQAIADRARATPEDISQGVKHAMSDGTLTAEEETNLRTFRVRMADHDLPSVITGSTTLNRASADRIPLRPDARLWATEAAIYGSLRTPFAGQECPTRIAGNS